jgi:hypothetical protein
MAGRRNRERRHEVEMPPPLLLPARVGIWHRDREKERGEEKGRDPGGVWASVYRIVFSFT